MQIPIILVFCAKHKHTSYRFSQKWLLHQKYGLKTELTTFIRVLE